MLTDGQSSQIAKRLFLAIDQEERKTLNKEQAVEFCAFLREHLFHGSYKEERDKSQIEALFDTLPTESFELIIPNPDYPEYPTITQEKRVKFKPLYEVLYP